MFGALSIMKNNANLFVFFSLSGYMDVGLSMTMDAIAAIQAKLMESMGSIASDMTKQITTLSEYDTSDIKGLLDDVDPVPVREFVEEAKPKIADYIDEMQQLAKKYIDIGIEKAKEAKDEIENEVRQIYIFRNQNTTRLVTFARNVRLLSTPTSIRILTK